MASRRSNAAAQTSARPQPPVAERLYTPAPELAAWALSTFVTKDAPLLNPEHAHLRFADVRFLWAADENSRQGRRVLGTAQLGRPRISDAWARGQREQQLREWFGTIPDFLITIDAGYWELADDAQACALIEHELLHCAQARDEFGMPVFTREGRPVWGMRPHDLEEFASVVERYGADATYSEAFRRAYERGPTIAAARIAGVCGSCLGR